MAGRVLKRSLLIWFAALVVLLACCSCSEVQPRTQHLVDLEEERPRLVAVLPFLNDSDFDQGGTLVQRVFSSELIKLDSISVSREGDVRSIYRELGIFPYQIPDLEQRRILGSRLKADVLINGRVKVMEEKRSGRYVNPVLALELHAYDGRTGRTLWTTHHRKKGGEYRTLMHFGMVSTVTGLSRKMSKEILEEWFPGKAQH